MNASALNRFSTRAAETGEALWPATVIIDTISYAAECPRPRDEKRALQPGYEELPDTRTVRIRKTLLAAAPALNSYLTMDDKQWQIRTIGGEGPSSPVWVLGLEPKK